MGSTIGKSSGNLLDALPSQGTLHVVMLGLDSAGKTTALYRLKFDQYLNTVPTIGFNCEKVQGTIGKAKGVQFLVWDVGGQEKLRPLWRSYTRCTDGILFVVDSVDVERMEEAKMELMRTAKCPDNQGVPVLILANKQDLPGARDPKELEKMLGLYELQQPTLHMSGVNMHATSSASTGNIIGCNTSGTNANAAHNVGSCPSSNYAAGRSLTPTTQHTKTFGGYGVSVSGSSSITKDLCMQQTTTKLYASGSTSTLIMEQHLHHIHTDGSSILGVGAAGTQPITQPDFICDAKTPPSSAAVTPTATAAQQPLALATSTSHTIPANTSAGAPGTTLLSKKWHGGTPGSSVATTAASTIPNALQYKGWYIQPACAITGEGLQEGLDALYEMILKRRKLNKAFKKRR